ncbi:Hypothetical predicted protein [Octopus vulgaris]|uniref:Uncharacterized protein n=1 Tax=Octopus vulgaris TaxID=6645 RepID=A0AA36BZH8_OCTVU|nr:Hypothetical predicted protein [Octopus vulgaris]
MKAKNCLPLHKLNIRYACALPPISLFRCVAPALVLLTFLGRVDFRLYTLLFPDIKFQLLENLILTRKSAGIGIKEHQYLSSFKD